MASRGEINKKEIQPILSKKWEVIPFVSSIENVGTFPKVKTSDCFEKGAYPVVDQSEKDIAGYINNDELLYKGDLPIVIFGDHTRNIKYVDFPFAAGADGTKILHSASGLDSKFFYYYLKSLQIPNLGYSRHFSILKQLDVPVPSLEEQKQIAAKLDKLFDQIETIKKSTERIPELLKNFRQQILTYAVTGKLTGEDNSLWELKTLNEFAIPKAGYAFKATDFIDNGIQVIRMGNLYDNKLSLDRSPVFIPKNYDTDIIERSKVRRNDILITLTGTKYKRDYGYAIKIDSDEVLLLNQRILSLTPLINPDYLLLALRGDEFRNQFFEFETGGVNQGNVGVKNVMTIKLHIPSSKIQEEIVKRTHALFDILDDVEKRYKTLCDKLDKLPQAILCKAFKGGLL